jgi:hypothetical protein
MAITQALDTLYNRWFVEADMDRDGRIMGGEAVAFLTRSGLPQHVLGQIWEAAAPNTAWLDYASFRRVCQLMWYAQQRGNELPPDSRGVVMKIVSGIATLPPPKLAGEELPYTLQAMQPYGIEMPAPPQPPQPTYSQGMYGQYSGSYLCYDGHRSHRGRAYAILIVIRLARRLVNAFRVRDQWSRAFTDTDGCEIRVTRACL